MGRYNEEPAPTVEHFIAEINISKKMSSGEVVRVTHVIATAEGEKTAINKTWNIVQAMGRDPE